MHVMDFVKSGSGAPLLLLLLLAPLSDFTKSITCTVGHILHPQCKIKTSFSLDYSKHAQGPHKRHCIHCSSALFYNSGERMRGGDAPPPSPMGSRVYGFMGSWVHGFMGSWVHGFMDSWVHGFTGL